MDRVIELLQKKNHFLEKFYSINEAELIRFTDGQFEGIEIFYENREAVLTAIQYLDKQIDELQNQTQIDFVLSSQEKNLVKEVLRVKEEYVNRILAQDLEILSCIEKEKSSIIRELQDLQKGKSTISKYKTPTFNKRLDEEA